MHIYTYIFSVSFLYLNIYIYVYIYIRQKKINSNEKRKFASKSARIYCSRSDRQLRKKDQFMNSGGPLISVQCDRPNIFLPCEDCFLF